MHYRFFRPFFAGAFFFGVFDRVGEGLTAGAKAPNTSMTTKIPSTLGAQDAAAPQEMRRGQRAFDGKDDRGKIGRPRTRPTAPRTPGIWKPSIA
jgi:hypothetical protein